MIDFVKYGRVITAGGNPVIINNVVESEDPFPIKGKVTANGVTFECEWDENGLPHRLPTTHGLDLLATVPRTTYAIISKHELDNANNFSDLIVSG